MRALIPGVATRTRVQTIDRMSRSFSAPRCTADAIGATHVVTHKLWHQIHTAMVQLCTWHPDLGEALLWATGEGLFVSRWPGVAIEVQCAELVSGCGRRRVRSLRPIGG